MVRYSDANGCEREGGLVHPPLRLDLPVKLDPRISRQHHCADGGGRLRLRAEVAAAACVELPHVAARGELLLDTLDSSVARVRVGALVLLVDDAELLKGAREPHRPDHFERRLGLRQRHRDALPPDLRLDERKNLQTSRGRCRSFRRLCCWATWEDGAHLVTTLMSLGYVGGWGEGPVLVWR